MKLQDTKSLLEVMNYDEANEHLKLGWVLINQYVSDYFGGQNPQHRHETIRYVLAWQGDGEPKRPLSKYAHVGKAIHLDEQHA